MKQLFCLCTLAVLILCFLGVPLTPAAERDLKPVADAMMGSSGINWVPKVSNARILLTVKRPDGTVLNKTFAPGSSPYIDLYSLYGENVRDGVYSYELVAAPVQDHRVRKSPEAAGLAKDHSLKQEPLKQTGYFQVREGMIVTSDTMEPGKAKTAENPSRTMDQVIYDDLIVDGSLCVGNDCYSGYAFGWDTIVMMENNLRVYFDDTSNTSSFPANDWRIVINDTTDGGGSYFAIQDVSGGKTPFTVEAGAKTNSLYVDDDGQVGIGTSGPVFELHIREGDTPTVRLQQDTSYGWPEQIWDVGGNETSFFIRDGSHGAKLPFRIEPDTPSGLLCLKSNGRVGIGTWSPAYKMELEATGENAEFVAERTSGAACYISGGANYGFFGTKTAHPLRLSVEGTWKMEINASGHYINMSDGGYYDGTWHGSSSRALKENIHDLTADDAMKTLEGLTPVRFNYKANKEEEHVGFIAEDVPDLVAANDRKSLSAMDIVAVLTKIVKEQQRIIQDQQKFAAEQQKINTELKKEIADMKKKADGDR